MRPVVQNVELSRGPVGLPRRFEEVLERIGELKQARDQVFSNMHRTAQILDGGERAVQALIGDNQQPGAFREMPTANYLRDAMDALASRLSTPPDLRIDPPTTGRKTDENDSRVKAAEKRARIVSHYDDHDELEQMLPQLARWVPGAAYSVATIDPVEVYGYPYPKTTLHWPLETMLAQWTPIQDPEDCGFALKVPVRELKHRYPHVGDRLDRHDALPGGAIDLSGRQRDGMGVEVVRYYDRHGTWRFVPDRQILLDFTENPLESGPAFVAFTKYNYGRLRGEFDDLVGLMISMARLQIMAEVAVRQNITAPTNLFGGEPLSGPYKKGFNATNVFDSQQRVEIPRNSIQFEAWQQIDRLERQLSIEATMPPQDRGESPMSFVTGRGLNELGSRVTRKVGEYHSIFARGIRKRDSKMLEYDEKAYGQISKPMQGTRKGAAFSEQYTPATHIKGNYRCVAPDSLVLTTDLRWLAAGDLTSDARLIGFDRNLNHGRGRSTPFQEASIEGLGERDMECVRVVTNLGEITVSLEHRFVVRATQHWKGGVHIPTRRAWKQAQHLAVGDSLVWLMEPWSERSGYEAGYVAGILDGEGSLDSSRTSFSQKVGPVLDQTILYLKQMGFEVNVYPGTGGTRGDVTCAKVGGGAYEQMRLLGELRPARLLPKSHILWSGRGMVTKGRGARGRSEAIVEAVERVGSREVVTMQTSTRTFISEGFACHNTSREYGALAGIDEAAALNALSIMDGAGWVSKSWIRDNIPRLGDRTKIESQLRTEGAEGAVMQMILAHANNPESPEHMRAFQMAIELLPAGELRRLAEKWLSERGEEAPEDELEALMAQQGAMGPSMPPPDPATVMSALTAGGAPRGGPQVVRGLN